MRQLGLQQLLYILCCMLLIVVSSLLHMAECILLSVQAAWPPGQMVLLESMAQFPIWLCNVTNNKFSQPPLTLAIQSADVFAHLLDREMQVFSAVSALAR